MSFSKAIGGFIELEEPGAGTFHEDSIKLNSGRSCFEYILLSKKPELVYLPKFTCDAMYEILIKLNIKYVPYDIDERLEIESDLQIGELELLVYTNYFGIKDQYVNKIVKQYGKKVIIDASQSFYMPAIEGCNVFYSPRKFFGVPDGGYLYTNNKIEQMFPKSISKNGLIHLKKRTLLGPEQAYADFCMNEERIANSSIEFMSEKTLKILNNIDYEEARNKRLSNFEYLNENLKEEDKIKFETTNNSGPMVYPVYFDKEKREQLIRKRIFIERFSLFDL